MFHFIDILNKWYLLCKDKRNGTKVKHNNIEYGILFQLSTLIEIIEKKRRKTS